MLNLDRRLELVETTTERQIQVDAVLEPQSTCRDEITVGLHGRPLRVEHGDIGVEAGSIPFLGEPLRCPSLLDGIRQVADPVGQKRLSCQRRLHLCVRHECGVRVVGEHLGGLRLCAVDLRAEPAALPQRCDDVAKQAPDAEVAVEERTQCVGRRAGGGRERDVRQQLLASDPETGTCGRHLPFGCDQVGTARDEVGRNPAGHVGGHVRETARLVDCSGRVASEQHLELTRRRVELLAALVAQRFGIRQVQQRQSKIERRTNPRFESFPHLLGRREEAADRFIRQRHLLLRFGDREPRLHCLSRH